MKKFLSYFVLILLFSLGLIYSLLFTSWGNGIVSNIVENKINEKKIIDFKFEKFKISTSEIEVLGNIDANSKILISGKYDIFDMSIDLVYNLDIKDLNKLKKFTSTSLNGSLKLDGIAIGNKEILNIKGSSNIFNSNTKYKIKLVDFEPSLINVKILKADLEKALSTLNQPLYSKGNMDLIINVKNAKLPKLDGTVLFKLSNGKLNNKIFNKDFKLNLKDVITFDSQVTSTLKDMYAFNSVDFNSSLFLFDVKEAKVNLKDFNANSDYKLEVKNLENFFDILQMKLKGAFNVSGNVKKQDEKIIFDAKSDLLKSSTVFEAKLVNNKLQDVKLQIQKLSLQNLLYTINQPSYAKGFLDITATIPNASVGELKGEINTKIYDGFVNNKVVNKNLEMKLKDKLDFKANSKTILNDNMILSSLNFYTPKANIFVKENKVDLKTMKIISDYQVIVKDLSKLYDVINTKMRGSLKLDGALVKDEDLLISGESKLLKGNISYKLLNNIFSAKVENIDVLKALYMMHYPEIFNSSANLDLTYDLEKSTGVLKGLLNNGKFVKNKYSSMLDKFARFDITKEVYEKVTLESKINKNIINSIMHFKSKHTKLDMTKSVFDTKKLVTDSLLKVNIKGLKFDTSIKGSINSPKLKVDAKKYLKSSFDKKKKVLKKKLEEKLKSEKFKKKQKELEDKIKNKLKSFF